MSTRFLVLPGCGNSGPGHWQSLWEISDNRFERVLQDSWEKPVRAAWVAALEKAVAGAPSEVVLVAHSLACLMVAHWAAATTTNRVKAAFLVAVPNPDDVGFPAAAVGFSAIPEKRLPFPSLVVASSDDPYGTIGFTQRCASMWGSTFVNIGPAGHINASSNLGDWPQGRTLLSNLLKQVGLGDEPCEQRG